MKIRELAQLAWEGLVWDVRNDGTRYVKTADTAPEWLADLCRVAHGGMPPDDWRYEAIRRCIGQLDECDDPDDAADNLEPDVWYVPDPNRAGDLEKLRERALLREFDEYRQSKQKRLRVFRLEAIRAGFKRAWQDREYRVILEVAEKLPEAVIQEDPKLLMWWDQAVTRVGEG